MSDNPVQRQMDIHFMQEKVVCNQVCVLHVPSRYQVVNIFAKDLSLQLLDDVRDNLYIRSPHVSSRGVIDLINI